VHGAVARWRDTFARRRLNLMASSAKQSSAAPEDWLFVSPAGNLGGGKLRLAAWFSTRRNGRLAGGLPPPPR
jgi:hypothetical protein